ncbi:hypothetical protein B7494_g388 [Chlorociboria aeruginascens]|nr:hypothetical protein B7494_g388 [Chlorociboria aeruginascens]
MEITKFVLSGREKAKLYGDSASYRAQLSNRIHNTRKKLGIATKPRAKYANKSPVTAEDIASNHEYVHLLLLTSERAWANAMSMREIHSTEKKGITGSTRSHIISRLHKAVVHATDLLRLLNDRQTTGASDLDILETRAYTASLTGAMEFEKQSWDACVRSYSEARVIYTALATTTKSDMFKDLLSDPVDPSLRYGAYQLRMPRTVAISTIARKFFPLDPGLISQVEKLDSNVLNDQPARAKTETSELEAIPKTISWRSRTVDLEDAAIATALVSVNTASKKLSETLASEFTTQPKDRAAAYDSILIASQDAVDATKHAIDELIAEGVGQGDKRMQGLQITRTAVSYDMVSWRIGRNRVLVGEGDGSTINSHESRPRKKKDTKSSVLKEEGTGRKLAHLREKVVLYEAILQSLDSIKELPGIAGDTMFLEELDAKYSYFQALKCLTIARSHALLSHPQNALALLNRAMEKCATAHSYLSSSEDTTTDSSPPNISISFTEVQYLRSLLQGELQHYRALVELSNLNTTAQKSQEGTNRQPLIERLHEYPAHGIDLNNLVSYPPKLEPVPVKPLFFDAAWNYIQYPGREPKMVEIGARGAVKTATPSSEQPSQQKKGWFGFGR